MSEQERDGIRHTIGHLAGLAIEAAGADANSVTRDAEHPPGPPGRPPLSAEDRQEAHAEAAKVRDAIRAAGNLLGGLLCDLNKIADSLAVLAGPPVRLEAQTITVPGAISEDQYRRIVEIVNERA